ncbi:hypothetical protein [Segnochrobactrum spirostomi]|uniref:Uncharacterized protein n=1 Tax=Segnochrobactrum spirostomi TaxID=2608987 RepID=A0A6A7XZB6_9HYPH|nr:hypothetical protein [Segnochrobactrum spirostomi]MQT11457.1 hypothetical protein [Segnochrobactrum spirostomi]
MGKPMTVKRGNPLPAGIRTGETRTGEIRRPRLSDYEPVPPPVDFNFEEWLAVARRPSGRGRRWRHPRIALTGFLIACLGAAIASGWLAVVLVDATLGR